MVLLEERLHLALDYVLYHEYDHEAQAQCEEELPVDYDFGGISVDISIICMSFTLIADEESDNEVDD